MTPIVIRTLDARETQARLDQLAALLVDAVAHGASVTFMAGFSHDDGRTFWRSQLPAIAERRTHLFVGDDGERLVATALLIFAHQPNAPHRAELGKMMVHSAAQRQGLGRRLLNAVETAARDAGRTLLRLETTTGSAGDMLYRSCGWTEIGRIPGDAFRPDGRLADTTLLIKALGPHEHPGAPPGRRPS